MMSRKWVYVPLIAASLGISSVQAHEHSHQDHNSHHGHGTHGSSATAELDANRPTPLAGESVYQLQSSWTNQDGAKVAITSLRGQPVVVAMLYTGCMAACPLTVSDMQRIEQGLPSSARGKVKFVVVSFDSEKDNPERLRQFARERGINTGTWTLYHGSGSDVRELAAVLGVKYKKDARGEYQHSNVITILDSEGVIRHQQVGLRADPAESIKTLSGLMDPKQK